jgi:aspartate-semialdehyde dehydrogenase
MASSDVAKEYVDVAISKGAVVIDNSSAFRMKENVPLVVPEVNQEVITKNDRLIANPNCSTIQLVVPLYLLSKINQIKRVDVSTYQAVSGAGKEAIDEFIEQIKNYETKKVKPQILPVKDELVHYEIINNAIPQIDVFENNNYTKEEMKVIHESQKILNKKMQISCTAVRIPVLNGHSESVTVTFENEVSLNLVKEAFNEEKNLIVLDDPKNQVYPLAKIANGKNEVFIGRVRKDIYANNILHFFVVADNLLKGAAANALQIAEKCYSEKIYGW